MPSTISRAISARRTSRPFAPFTLACLAAVLATACGGGGNGDADSTTASDGTLAPPATTPPAAITLAGTVTIDWAVRNVRVWVDLDGNGSPDGTEPASAAAGVDGRYTITYQPADTAAAATFRAAPVLVAVTKDSVDAGDAQSTVTTTAYTLAAPAGTTDQININPLTTLVQHGIAGGLTREAAETAVAQQLGIAVAKIYNYQDDPSPEADLPFSDTARIAAQLTASALELGGTLAVTPPGAAPIPSVTLQQLDYTDAQNYTYRLRTTDGVVATDGYVQTFENRAGQIGGLAVSNAELYSAVRVDLAANGWQRCDQTVPLRSTRGTPTRTLYCNGASTYLGFTLATENIAGQSVAEVVSRIQGSDSRFASQEFGNVPSIPKPLPVPAGTAFPNGSTLRTSISLQFGQPQLYINDTTGTNRFGFTSLKQMIAARPVGNVNTVTSAGTVGALGPVDDADHVLRAAFVDGATVQFYKCEGTFAQNYNDAHNCAAHSRSAFTIETVNGVPLLRFASFPGAAQQGGLRRGYTEYDGAVYAFRQPADFTAQTQALTYSNRLNGTACEALKKALNIS